MISRFFVSKFLFQLQSCLFPRYRRMFCAPSVTPFLLLKCDFHTFSSSYNISSKYSQNRLLKINISWQIRMPSYLMALHNLFLHEKLHTLMLYIFAWILYVVIYDQKRIQITNKIILEFYCFKISLNLCFKIDWFLLMLSFSYSKICSKYLVLKDSSSVHVRLVVIENRISQRRKIN